MPVIVPAILSKHPEEIDEKLRLLEIIPEVSEAQIDFADGRFVPNITAMPKELFGLRTNLSVEAHLMVQNPQNYFHDLERLPVNTVILHYESFHSTNELLTAIRNAKVMGFRCGVAVNPNTEIAIFEDLKDEVDMAVILGVHPGYQGKVFLSETLDRAADLRKRLSDAIIEVDGGVNLENFSSVVAHGADRVVIGSAIWHTKDSKKSIEEFFAKLK